MLKSVPFRDKQIRYEMYGQGLPVMLLHGFTEDRQIWNTLLATLGDSCQWLIPDLPGSGESDFNLSLNTLADFAESLLTILEAEQIHRFVLIGHSMGGYISLAFAEKYPERLAGLGLFHSSSYPDTDEKKEARRKNIRFIESKGADLFVSQSIPGLYADSFKTEHPDEIQHQISRYANFNPESLVQYLNAMISRPATTPVLNTITKPVLFIMGTEDKAIPLNIALEQCHLPKVSYIHILPRTAHMGMIENTIGCSSIIAQFLEQIPS